MKKLLRCGLAAMATVSIAACGDASAGGPQEASASLHDFAIELSRTEFDAGTISFAIENEGPSVHEFLVVRSDEESGSLPVTDGAIDEEILDVIDEAADIAVGDTAALEVTLEPGTYIVLCNLPGHYQSGMHIGISVD